MCSLVKISVYVVVAAVVLGQFSLFRSFVDNVWKLLGYTGGWTGPGNYFYFWKRTDGKLGNGFAGGFAFLSIKSFNAESIQNLFTYFGTDTAFLKLIVLMLGIVLLIVLFILKTIFNTAKNILIFLFICGFAVYAIMSASSLQGSSY